MNKKGSAYIYALVIMTAISVMLSIVVGIAAYQAKVTTAYNMRAGMYELCASAIENAVDNLNRSLTLRYDALCDSALSKISDLNNITLYHAGETSYDGEFHLKPTDTKRESGEKYSFFEKHFVDEVIAIENDIFKDSFERLLNPYTNKTEYMSSYCIGTDISSDPKYYITVWITPMEPNLWAFTTHVSLTSEAQKNSIYTVSAQVSIYSDGHYETVIPHYEWKVSEKPQQFDFSVFASGKVQPDSVANSPYVQEEVPVSFDDLIDSSVPLAERNWSELDAVVIVDSAGDITLNTGTFYDSTGFVNTVIINKGLGKLTLYGDEFHGLIISRGEVNLDVKEVRGSVICGSNVTLNPISSITYVDDLPFSVRISDQALSKMLFDYMRIADFKSSADEVDIDSILRKVKISNKSSIEINRFDEFTYKIVKLQQGVY